MILAITIKEMQRLNVACKRVLGTAEWTRRSEVAWESLQDLEFVTADMLESALLDGMDISTGVHFDGLQNCRNKSLGCRLNLQRLNVSKWSRLTRWCGR
jgi:hypothetical protein